MIGIDLGTANTVVFLDRRGIVLQEPSILAVNERGRVVAVGRSAKEMVGKTPGDVYILHPLRDGVIADFESTRSLLKHFISSVHRPSALGLRPTVLISIPSSTSQVERRAIEEAAIQAGAHQQVYLIEEPIAAAIGIGIDIAEPRGRMIVDIGGGTTDIAIISCGGVAVGQMIKTAGGSIDEAIRRSIRQRYNLLIGERMAEQIKIELGGALPPEECMRSLEVSGRDLAAGLPTRVTLTEQEVHSMIAAPLAEIVKAVCSTIEQCPPEILSDLFEEGMYLTGGGALIRGLDERLHRETGLPVQVAPNAMTAVAEGTGRAIMYLQRKKTAGSAWQKMAVNVR